VPDVCLLHRDSPVEQIVTTPPLLCVEVLSPDDRMSEMQERIDDYLAMGVALVWLIDPRKRRAWLHTPEGASEARDALRVPGTPVEVSLSWLFEDLPAR
jgi:Uma2 family endonuclease